MPPRRHDLDALRACAMLLGIALHAAVAYNTFGWLVTDPSQSPVFDYLFHFIHGFRMQLFFMISGFFTALLYQKRGLSALLRHRFQRIFLPLLIFTPIFIPLTEWVLRVARHHQGSPSAPTADATWLQTFSLHHHWFLWFLCLMVLGFALLSKLPFPKIPPLWRSYPRCLLWLIPLTMLPQACVTRDYPLYGVETSASLLPIPHVFFYYTIFFGFGILFFNAHPTQKPSHWRATIAFSTAVLFPATLVAERIGCHSMSQFQWVSDFLQVSFTWLMVFGCIHFFKEKCAHPSAKLRYLSDASYWLYLAHLPLVFYIQFLIRDRPLNCWIKFPLVILSSFTLLLLSYHFLVRGKPIGKLLNGKQ